jgi:hypothetical protein
MRYTCTFALLFACITAIAQAPQSIPYQAVARDTSGNLLSNTAVSVRLSVHNNVISGPVVYSETHNVVTSPLGLFNINIGTGSIVTGVFNGIDWASGSKFLQVELDPSGGSNYIDMGTQQLLSVPYALFAQTAGYTPGAGIDISGNAITNTGDTDPADDLTNTSVAAGDVTGAFSNLQIAPNSIDGSHISLSGNTQGSLMYYNGTDYVPLPAGTTSQVLKGGTTPSWGVDLNSGGTVTSITAGQGLDGGTINTSGTISVSNLGITNGMLGDNSVTASKIQDGVISNADISTSASIARSKIATGTANHIVINSGTGSFSSEAQLAISRGGTGLSSIGSANQLLGVNSGASLMEYKNILGTANQVNVAHAANAITFSLPQNIHSAAAPTFAGLTLSSALPVASGGTGLATAGTSGQVLAVASTGTLLEYRTITSPSNHILISNTSGNIQLSLPQAIAASSAPTFSGLTLSSPLSVTNGGTGSASIFTAGSVVFAGTSGVYNQDNASLFWDNTNNRLGIGTASPTSTLDVNGNIELNSTAYKITRGSGTADLIPVAYGSVQANGTIDAGTNNFTVAWNTTNNFYEITISGESYSFAGYTTVVTPVGSTTPRFATTNAAISKLVVRIFDSSGSTVQNYFHFIVYQN